MPDIFNSSDQNQKSSKHPKESMKHKSEESSSTPKRKGSRFFTDHPKSKSLLAAFATNPVDVCFNTQDHGEQILLLLRQHPITQIAWIATAVGMALVPILLNFIGFLSFMPANYLLAGLVGWYMLISGYALESALKWFYNVYIVTDERFIDIDFDSLLYKNVSAAKIDSIQDVTAESKGVLAAFFDFGHIYLQTAAEKREFEFLSVPHPQRIKKIINELILEEEQEEIEGRVR
jgi:hypothetical protein